MSLLAILGAVPVLAQEVGLQTTPELDAVNRWRADPATVFRADEVDLADFKWIARPVVIFAEAPQQPDYQEQMDLIADRAQDLADRDVLVVVDTDPAAFSDLRRQLRPRGFQFTLIGKDGEVKLRKPFPWDVREITRSIDKMPMRQREIREGGS
ncbi:DUF4174 domain-containing protein [Palleronia sp. THAF1]|uniref:DUF4174 domain-containing protein n=1 Tax=Palleronia sp. THAF1 TaxID=2587842 RepID=UPI0020C7D5B1|nr:DUF4174 domain-containing protein [Palleronia sp. THAF1]